jgi:hypothetical protein
VTAPALHLETVYTSPRFFGIETATPVQRAICRIAEGRSLERLAEHPEVRDAVGGDEALSVLAPGAFRPRELDLLCAIRSGKSFFVAAHQFWSSMTAQLGHLKAGEVPRHPVLSVNLKSAEATFHILAGTVLARPAMRPLLVGEVGTDSLMLRHPSGRHIECNVAAGARGGSTFVSVWLTGAALEEFPRQAGEGSGAIVNYDEQLRAAAGRVVEGGQILSVGSPWAPFGPAFERYTAHFGKPSPERVVIKATGPMMNPSWWTPARCEALQRSNPTAYVTDVLAGFADQATALIPVSDLQRATRKGPVIVPPRAGARYVAAMDPASRGDRWCLIVAEYEDRGDGTQLVRIVLAKQWRGTPAAPLQPDSVLSDIAYALRDYGLSEIWSDQLASDFIADIARRHGLTVEIETTTAASKYEMFESLRARIADGAVELPDDPAVRADLQAVRKVVTRIGVSIDLPRTAEGHCDYAPPIALVVSKGGEGEASWLRAMKAWRGGEPEAPRGPSLVLTTSVTGEHQVSGRPPFSPAEAGRFFSGRDDVRWSEQASESFKAAVQELRRARSI